MVLPPLSWNQIGTLREIVSADSSLMDLRDVVEMVFSTGALMRDLAQLRWTHFDVSERSVTLGFPRLPRRVPLFGNEIQTLLEERKQRQGSSELVFEGAVLDGIRHDMKQVSLRLGMVIGYARLRHTFANRIIPPMDCHMRCSILGGGIYSCPVCRAWTRRATRQKNRLALYSAALSQANIERLWHGITDDTKLRGLCWLVLEAGLRFSEINQELLSDLGSENE